MLEYVSVMFFFIILNYFLKMWGVKLYCLAGKEKQWRGNNVCSNVWYDIDKRLSSH